MKELLLEGFFILSVVGISILLLGIYSVSLGQAPGIHGQYYSTNSPNITLCAEASCSGENSDPIFLILVFSVYSALLLLSSIFIYRILQRRLLQERLEHQKRMLQKELQLLRRLSKLKINTKRPSKRSLEIKNPKTLALVLAKQIDNELQKHFANDVEGAIAFLQELIEQLKDRLKRFQ